MGLLDEAIREHLELKRRRGADPGEIARAERAALEPVFDEAPDEHEPDEHLGDGGAPAPEQTQLDHVAEGEQGLSAGASADGDRAELQLAEFGSPGQETAEIDMRAVLDEDHHGAGLAASAHLPAAQHAPAPAGGSAQEDGLEWEMPSREAREAPPEQVPGQERLSFE
jgi:hypothetical protein